MDGSGVPRIATRAAFVPAGFDPDPRFRWIVVATHFGAERIALASLIGLLGCAYLPLFYDPPRTAGARRMRAHRARAQRTALRVAKGFDATELRRRQKVGKANRAPLDADLPTIDPDVMPLFRGYVFAQVDLDEPLWPAIDDQHGVAGIVRLGRAVGTVPLSCRVTVAGRVVQAGLRWLWSKCDAAGVIRADPEGIILPPAKISAGTRVRIRDDADSPLAGQEGLWTKDDRMELLRAMMGREGVLVDVDQTLIEVVAAGAR